MVLRTCFWIFGDSPQVIQFNETQPVDHVEMPRTTSRGLTRYIFIPSRGVARVTTRLSTALTIFMVTASPLAHAGVPQLIDSRVTQSTLNETICNPSYFERVVPTFDALAQRKQQLLKEQGIDLEAASDYAIEFRLPVILGGVPDITENIDLRRWDGASGARRKRRLTVFLRRCVCRGELPLRRAQTVILGDWAARYTHLWSSSCRDLR